MNNVSEVLEKLAAKQFDALIGVSEAAWLDAKESPYILDTLKQKLELAKDVSALANSAGGVIVLGLIRRETCLRRASVSARLSRFPST